MMHYTLSKINKINIYLLFEKWLDVSKNSIVNAFIFEKNMLAHEQFFG